MDRSHNRRLRVHLSAVINNATCVRAFARTSASSTCARVHEAENSPPAERGAHCVRGYHVVAINRAFDCETAIPSDDPRARGALTSRVVTLLHRSRRLGKSNRDYVLT